MFPRHDAGGVHQARRAPHAAQPWSFRPAVQCRTMPSVVSRDGAVSSPSPSRPSEPRPELPPLPCGCIVNSVEESKSWVLNSMPHQFVQAKLFSTAVYHEMRRTEPPGRRHTVANIPDDGDSRRMSDLCGDSRRTSDLCPHQPIVLFATWHWWTSLNLRRHLILSPAQFHPWTIRAMSSL